MSLIIPRQYRRKLLPETTEVAIKMVKDAFQATLAKELNLRRVTAPLFLLSGTGLNDDLNGVEHAVSFEIDAMGGRKAEVVHSLAKWKRCKLEAYGIPPGYGLYTIYKVVRDVEQIVYERFPHITPRLPEKIVFIHADELARLYPDMGSKEREAVAAREHGAVFIIGIGADLCDGKPHDGRAPDYDDWSTPNEEGTLGLNGDLILWDSILEIPFELSSMGIRVSPESLRHQLSLRGASDKERLSFHRMLLAGQLPHSIGGGIGQSRLAMFLLHKAHIGEVQASIWPEEQARLCAAAGIELL